jgi:hypothetical protein
MQQPNTGEIAPFDKSFVLRLTAKHQRKALDISIRKTFERIKDFPDDTIKSAEVFETLMLLHAQRAQLDEFQQINSEHFKGK